MEDDEPLLSIGELAKRTGLPVRTIRFWSDAGVLPPAARTGSGRRLYDTACVARLELVVTLRELGLGLPDVRRVLDGQVSIAEVAAVHLQALDAQIRALRLHRAVLAVVVKRAAGKEEMTLMNKLARMSVAERRHQDVGQPAELAAPGDQVVLLAAVPAGCRAGAGLEHRDTAGVAFLGQPLAGVGEQPCQDPLTRLIMHDQVRHAAALRRRVLGAAGRLQVQPATVPEQHAGGLASGRDRAEQAAPRRLRRQLPLPASGEDDAVLVPEPEDTRVHKAKTRHAAPWRLPVRHWRQAGQTRTPTPRMTSSWTNDPG